MTSPSGESSIGIPSVTEQDLFAFHSSHFADAPLPTKFFTVPEEDEEYYYEENELGYYDDGTKRTLTNEQISMFRHSEIQALLRERRLRAENDDTSDDEVAPTESSHAAAAYPLVETKQPSLTVAPQNREHSDDGPHDKSKRKWDAFIDDAKTNPQSLTHRRLARELDELKTEAMDLAYGDDEPPPSKSVKAKAKPQAGNFQGRKLVSYDGLDE